MGNSYCFLSSFDAAFKFAGIGKSRDGNGTAEAFGQSIKDGIPGGVKIRERNREGERAAQARQGGEAGAYE